MIKYKKTSIEIDSICKIVCNKCGLNIPRMDDTLWEDAIDISYTFGYGSTRDGDKYIAHLCEQCYIAFTNTFYVPPEITTLYGYMSDAN